MSVNNLSIPQAEQALRNILDNTSEGIYSVDRQYRVISFNKAFAEFFKSIKGRELIEGEDLACSLPPHEQERFKGHCDRAFGGERFVAEFQMELNGEHYWFKATHHPITENENVTGVAIFSRNITESKIAQLKLIEQQTLTQDLLDNLPADIALFDTSHKYVFINPVGVRNEEMRKWLIGKDDFDYCVFKNIDNSIAIRRRALFNEVMFTLRDVEWVDEHESPEGNQYMLRKFHPILENGKVKFVLGYGINITDLKRKDAELRKMTVELIKAEETERSRIAYEMHDGLSQLLASAKLNLSIIPSSTDFKQVEDLLILAIKETRNISNNLAPKTLRDEGLIKAVEALVQQIVQAGSINISFFPDARFDDKTLSEHIQFNLYRVIQETLNNATRHANAKSITISLSWMEPELVISCSDDGTGISPEALAKSTSFIAIRRRINILSGTFEITSNIPGRVTFTYTIPLNKTSQLTNSNYGSSHWFNTLMSRQKAIAEILTNSTPQEAQTKQLAESLYKTTEELIKGWNHL